MGFGFWQRCVFVRLRRATSAFSGVPAKGRILRTRILSHIPCISRFQPKTNQIQTDSSQKLMTSSAADGNQSAEDRTNAKKLVACLPLRRWKICPRSINEFPLQSKLENRPIKLTLQIHVRTKRKSTHGKNRVVVQTARLHISVIRNLRGHQWLLGLRSAWRRT